MSDAIAGKFSVMEIGSGGVPPTSWSELTEVYDIGDLPIRLGTYDVTSHGASRYREILPGLFEISELTMNANYVQAQYDQLYTMAETISNEWFRLRWPDDTAHTFSGYITDVTPTTPLDERITYAITITVTGQIAYAPI